MHLIALPLVLCIPAGGGFGTLTRLAGLGGDNIISLTGALALPCLLRQAHLAAGGAAAQPPAC